MLLLADLLSQRGWNVDVLSRGYGRSSKTVARVDAAGTPEEFGDEPLLMARHGLSVYVGASRYDPGKLAEKEAAADSANSRVLHILDDGFQHRKLARAIDIVLLQRADLKGSCCRLGACENHSAACAAQTSALLRAEDADLSERVLQLMGQPAKPPMPLAFGSWSAEPPFLRRSFDSERAGILRHRRCHRIFQWPKARRRLTLQTTIAFRDHHVYTVSDISRLKALASRSGANCFVTTEKDSVRLSAELRAELEKHGPLVIAGLELRLQEEKRCIDGLESLLQERLQLHPRNVR